MLNEGCDQTAAESSPGLQGFSRTFQIWPPGDKSKEWEEGDVDGNVKKNKKKKKLPQLGWRGKYSFYVEVNIKKEKSSVITL